VVFEDHRRGAVDVRVHVGVPGLEVLPHEKLVLRLFEREFVCFEKEKKDFERVSLFRSSPRSLL